MDAILYHGNILLLSTGVHKSNTMQKKSVFFAVHSHFYQSFSRSLFQNKSNTTVETELKLLSIILDSFMLLSFIKFYLRIFCQITYEILHFALQNKTASLT